MYHSSRIALLLLLLASPSSATVVEQFSHGFGGTSVDVMTDVAYDAQGNVVMSGYFGDTVDFGGTQFTSLGGLDAVVGKYDPQGQLVWARRIGDSNTQFGHEVATDTEGNVLFGADYRGTPSFGGSNFSNAGEQDIGLAKYREDSVYLWGIQLGSTASDGLTALATDSQDAAYAAGTYRAPIDVGGGTLPLAGVYDSFLVKLDANGAYQWSRSFSASAIGATVVHDIGVDAQDNVFVCGAFLDTIDAGGGVLTAAAAEDGFVAKYDANGNHIFSLSFGGFLNDRARSLVTLPSGSVLVTGDFNGTVNFGGGNRIVTGGVDMFLVQYDANGNWEQDLQWSGDSHVFPLSMTRAAGGAVTVGGHHYGSVDFGAGPVPFNGNRDAFLVRFDAAWNAQWSTGYGSSQLDALDAIAEHPAGRIAVAGTFYETIAFPTTEHTSAGNADMILAQVSVFPQEPSILAITDIGHDQGGRVRIEVERSGYDDAVSAFPITSYEVYRRNEDANKLEDWTFVGSAPAHGDFTYTVEAPTLGDNSITGGPYDTTFLVRAASADPGVFFDSAVAVGQSIDNLAPAQLQNLAHNVGVLTWDDATEPDLDYYTVYGGDTDYASAQVVGSTVTTSLDVSLDPSSRYWVTATDFAGNESTEAGPLDVTTTGLAPELSQLWVRNHPNPFNPKTTVVYNVPRTGAVRLDVVDVRGRHIVTLVDRGDHPSGIHQTEWDGRGRKGNRVASGVYLARIRTPEGTQTRKLSLVE